MRILNIVVICLLVFLAVSSGVTKIMLMPQDTDFFGKYGFSNPMLIIFGAVQVIGGLMLIASKTRGIGASLVAVTFAISAVLLILERNIPFTGATLIALVLLVMTIRHARNTG